MKILYVPSIKKGNGIGHLKRCIKYVSESSESCYLYIPGNINISENINSLIRSLNDKVKNTLNENYDVIITDLRECSEDEYELYLEKSDILIGLDEGGQFREKFPFLIDTLPNLSNHKPNIFSTGLLGIKDNRVNTTVTNINNILVSFGGEDPENLTEKILDIFSSDNYYKKKSIKAVKGPLFNNILKKYENIDVIESPSSLENHINNSDLVITSFGITAYEALYAGKYVILLNPSDYHSKLSLKAGIPEIKSADNNMLKKMISSPFIIREKTKAVLKSPADLNDVILSLKKNGIDKCLFCGAGPAVLQRFFDRNYYCCNCSDLIFMERFCSDKMDYGKNYFFDDYKKQYGKTYLEDFENIKKMSDKRIQTIRKYIKKGRLLDIGCAYGPFLKAADELCFDTTGIDVSVDAVEYVNNKLKIKAFKNDFSREDLPLDDVYDVVTMWYVIEHFKNTDYIIEKVKSILADGGVFAFSTPNFSGISVKTEQRKALLNSPGDHYTYWSIKSASEILRKKGFKILSVKNTGHHPERFNKKIKKIIPYTVLKHISFLLKLGDTFEIYAMKK